MHRVFLRRIVTKSLPLNCCCITSTQPGIRIPGKERVTETNTYSNVSLEIKQTKNLLLLANARIFCESVSAVRPRMHPDDRNCACTQTQYHRAIKKYTFVLCPEKCLFMYWIKIFVFHLCLLKQSEYLDRLKENRVPHSFPLAVYLLCVISVPA